MPKYIRTLWLLGIIVCALGISGRATAAESAEALANAWVRAKGWHIGFDRAAHRLVVVTSATISAKPTDHTAYIVARQAAFTNAMADARTAAAKFLNAEIASSLELHNSVVEVLGDPALAKALTGVASHQGSKASSELAEAISVTAEAALVGLYACETFESTNSGDQPGVGSQIAVVAAIGPSSAGASRGQIIQDPSCKSTGLEVWFNAIPEDQLARTFGVRFQFDENCIIRPVSFGQAKVQPGSLGLDSAARLASGIAESQLNALLGEAVAAQALLESASQSGESSDTPPYFRSVTKYQDSVRAAAKSSFGLEQVARRTVKDPATGASLVVVAVTISAPAVSADRGSKPAPTSVSAPRAGVGCPPVPPEMASSIHSTQASGSGPTKTAALESALLEVIRREGVSVKGNSVLERQFQEAMESAGGEVHEKVSSRVDQSSKVETFSKGFVYSYDLIKESNDSGLWEVTICANLVRFDPKNPRFGLPPTVAVLPFVCAPGGVRVAGAAVACEEASSPCEQAIEGALAASRSFTVLGERDQPKLRQVRDDIEHRVASGRSEEIEAVKLGRELTADFIVLGKITRAEFTGQAGQRPQNVAAADTATATVEARMVNVSSSEVAWVKSTTVTLMGRDILLVRAGRSMKDPSEQALSPLQLAVSRASAELADSLAKAFPVKLTAPSATAEPVLPGSK